MRRIAGVTIDSGEFPLLRNIDINHQPSRSKVRTEWITAFSHRVPDALKSLADVIEDVIAYPKIYEDWSISAEEFLERIGITGLPMDDPTRLVKALRGELGPEAKDEVLHKVRLTRAERIPESQRLVEEGLSLRQAAEELGVSRQTVLRDVVSQNSVMTQKCDTPRKRTTYQLTQYTKPETAARRIREVFGDEFWQALMKCDVPGGR